MMHSKSELSFLTFNISPSWSGDESDEVLARAINLRHRCFRGRETGYLPDILPGQKQDCTVAVQVSSRLGRLRASSRTPCAVVPIGHFHAVTFLFVKLSLVERHTFYPVRICHKIERLEESQICWRRKEGYATSRNRSTELLQQISNNVALHHFLPRTKS